MAAEEGNRKEGESSSKRRRRRRRRNRRPNEASADTGRPKTRRSGSRSWRGRDDAQPAVNLPASGRGVVGRPSPHGDRGKVSSAGARRRRMSRADMDQLTDYLERMPEPLLKNLYSGLGGQPGRVSSKARMIQLAVRAIAQGSRLGSMVKALHQRDRQALAILVQVGGIAQAEELHQELAISLGGNEREWKRVMANLGDKGLVNASETRDDHFFYLVSAPLIDHLMEYLHDDLMLSSFDEEGVRAMESRPFQPPLDFSIVTLASYIDRHPPRLTQRHDIFKVHKEEMDQFFSQLWEPDSELFSFHIEFLMQSGMVELKGDRLSVNRAVMEEWLQIDPEGQRDLVFSALNKRFPHAEWVLWAIHDAGGAWITERPLQALYRRWRRGEDWRQRFHKGQWASPRTAQRDTYTFTPLVHAGMLEMGEWGQEKFFRLTPRAQHLLSPPTDEEFAQFYLTPNFEIMAPAGLSPLLLFRIGEIAEINACDRANTYRISEVSIEQALEKGWRRDDVLEFLRENSQIGLPENVEQTLRGWMGHHGDVEFHDVMLLTVHRSQIRRLESHRQIKPFLIHRFVPGMYAVDRSRMPELNAALMAAGFTPGPQIRKYPDDPQQVDARERLLQIVTLARQEREDLVAIAQIADTAPEDLHLVPGTTNRTRTRRKRRDDLPPRRSPREVGEICERAIALGQHLQMMYVTRNQERKLLRIAPERLATNPAGQQVLVGRDVAADSRLSYQVLQIERLSAVDAAQ